MFERYTETGRRAIFFARYEASQFGSPFIEAEHLLLGLFREDKALASRFLPSHAAIESLRTQIEAHTTIREKLSTSVDLPLSHECKRALVYGAEEAERLNQRYIGPPHLLLGLVREENSFAAHLLREQGLSPDLVREEVRQSETPPGQDGPVALVGFERWIDDLEARGVWAIKQERIANRTTSLDIYAPDKSNEGEEGNENNPAEKLAQIRKRLHSVSGRIERAIANHEFQKARLYADDERKERENMRLLREEFNLEEPPPPLLLLRVEIVREDRFSDVQRRCDNYMAQGVPQVWILNPNVKRAYTVAKTEGLREFKGEILRLADPPLEMDLREIFD
jgi:Uma2 family endonuclease